VKVVEAMPVVAPKPVAPVLTVVPAAPQPTPAIHVAAPVSSHRDAFELNNIDIELIVRIMKLSPSEKIGLLRGLMGE